MQWTNGAWTFVGMTLSEMPTSVAFPTSHHLHPSLSLTFTGHLARMDENADASQAIFEPPPENWRQPAGQPCTTWMRTARWEMNTEYWL